MVWVDIENGESGASVRAKLNVLGRLADTLAPIAGTSTVLARLIGANLNSIADQVFVPAFAFADFIPLMIIASNASGTIVNAQGGIYTGPNKTGLALVSAAQSWTAFTGPTKVIFPTISPAGQAIQTYTGIYLSLTTPAGTAGTCDIRILGIAR